MATPTGRQAMAEERDLVGRMGETVGRVAGEAQAIADRVVPEDERSLVRRAFGLPFYRKASLVARLWRDPRLGNAVRLPMLAGVAYLVLPLKLTPKKLGPLRAVENFAALLFVLWLIVRITPRQVIEEHLAALEVPTVWQRLMHRE